MDTKTHYKETNKQLRTINLKQFYKETHNEQKQNYTKKSCKT